MTATPPRSLPRLTEGTTLVLRRGASCPTTRPPGGFPMQTIDINGRTYEMDAQTAEVLRDMMERACRDMDSLKARAALMFIGIAEGFGRARRIPSPNCTCTLVDPTHPDYPRIEQGDEGCPTHGVDAQPAGWFNDD